MTTEQIKKPEPLEMLNAIYLLTRKVNLSADDHETIRQFAEELAKFLPPLPKKEEVKE